MTDFVCCSVSPIALDYPGIAIATARAGTVGLLDMKCCGDTDKAMRNVGKPLASIADNHQIGLRLHVKQIAQAKTLLNLLGNCPHWLVLSASDPTSFRETISGLPASESRRLLREVTAAGELSAIGDLHINGLVARRHEAGGWVGEDTSFILAQKLLARQSHAVHIQSGTGTHTRLDLSI